jgi:Spy/CpxP family protein refolding chaperone
MDYQARYTQLTQEQQQVYQAMRQQQYGTPERCYLESRYQAIRIERRALERLLNAPLSVTKRGV